MLTTIMLTMVACGLKKSGWTMTKNATQTQSGRSRAFKHVWVTPSCLAAILAAAIASSLVLRTSWARNIETLPTSARPSSTAIAANTRMTDVNSPKVVDETSRLLEESLSQLRAGQRYLEKQTGYRSIFIRQEQVGAELNDAETIQVEIRHSPFSVRMDWEDSGQKLVYVDGEHDNQIRVRLGGIKRLLGVIQIDPLSPRVMEHARHPITEIGLLNMTKLLLQVGERDLSRHSGVKYSRLPDAMVGDRLCHVYRREYVSPAIECEFPTSIISIDKNLGLPLRIENFAAPQTVGQNDQDQLIEHYEYQQVEFMSAVTADSFVLASSK